MIYGIILIIVLKRLESLKELVFYKIYALLSFFGII